jgi:hypothetical protein
MVWCKEFEWDKFKLTVCSMTTNCCNFEIESKGFTGICPAAMSSSNIEKLKEKQSYRIGSKNKQHKMTL